MPYDAKRLYQQVMRPDTKRTEGAFILTQWAQRVGSMKVQIERDIALWYGALIKPGSDPMKLEMLTRLFKVLFYGGLMVDRGDKLNHNWVPWCSFQLPICCALSHTARILISMPPGKAGIAFWRWLWADEKPRGRGMATHGVSGTKKVIDIYPPFGILKEVKETKGLGAGIGMGGNHYGVNIPLGGHGNNNPVSGHLIDDGGEHGHLYLAYGTNKRGRHARQSLLVGVEQSAPWDRYRRATPANLIETAQIKAKLKKGVPDQYGGFHGAGGHNRYSCTGGDDFSYKNVPSALESFGPKRGHYIDGMFIDLSEDRFDYLRLQDFPPEYVADPGRPPIPRWRPTPSKLSPIPQKEPAEYYQVLCVALRIKTADVSMGEDTGYKGHSNAETDIRARCAVMKTAIRQAFSNVAKVPGGSDKRTLKLFMAPEFFFRSARGAYRIKYIHHIIENIRQETQAPKYENWLFVLGTAVGQIRLNEEVEILNIALIQKGGVAEADGIHDRVVYKEYMSGVDFIRPYGFHLGSHWRNPDTRKIVIGGSSQSPVPTPGSRDIGAMGPHDLQSETQENAYDGASIFTMDNLTIGLEVCRDHFMQRLKSRRVAPDEHPIQIQLVPAAGMDIREDSVACMNQGVIFNVDGATNSAELKVRDGGILREMSPHGTDTPIKTPKKYFYDKGHIRLYKRLKVPRG